MRVVILPSTCLSWSQELPPGAQETVNTHAVAVGEKDFAFQQGLVEAIGRHFVPGRLESHILPGSGHWIPQSHPQEMHQYMWAFLQDLLG